MSLKKTVAIAAAAGALAAISLPAMAMENQFNGQFNVKGFVSNYEAGGSGYITPANDTRRANNYFEQRARLYYTAKASDDLKLVLGFEIDSVWGDRAQGGLNGAGTDAFASTYTGAFRNSGGAMESDAVNLETKHAYLNFKIPSIPTTMTVGIQPIKDVFKGILFDVDIAGITAATKVGGATIGLGYYRGYDNSYLASGAARPRGMDSLHIGAVTTDFALSKDLNIGAAYYLYEDGRAANSFDVHTFGATYGAKLGALSLSGFAAMQQGVLKTVPGTTYSQTHAALSGYAFNTAAKMAVGPGAFRTAFLFTTGDNGGDNINTAWQGVMYSATTPSAFAATSGNTYNEGGMMLLNRNAAQHGAGAQSTDYSLVYSSNNKNQGVWLYTLGYDATITPKAYLNSNLGFAWASKTNANKPTNLTDKSKNGSNFEGSEINVEAGYKMYDNLTFKFQVAYVMLGGYYTDSTADGKGKFATPENPYSVRTGLCYAF